MEEFLAVDVGSARVGVARGNTAARLAEPLATIPANEAGKQLEQIASERQAAGIVVGLPRSLDGHETKQTKQVRRWAEHMKQQIGLPFYWQDEALTSRAAERRAPSAGSDAEAAAIILQDFLDTDVNDRVAV